MIFDILLLLIAVYALIALLAYWFGHPTPLRWYRPDMHPDDANIIDGFACEVLYDTRLQLYRVTVPELFITACGKTEAEAKETLRQHIRIYFPR